MSSYRNYNDLSTYRPRSSSSGVNISLIRNPTAGGSSTIGGYRSNYSNIGSTSRSSISSSTSKDRIVTGSASSVYRNAFLKRDQNIEDKSPYKYSSIKATNKSRLNVGRSNYEDIQTKSNSDKSTLLDKYSSYSGGKSNERVSSSSVLDKYGSRVTAGGGEKSRVEAETSSRYGVNRDTGLRGNYENKIKAEEKNKECSADHPAISYKPLRISGATSSRSSREPSPEINGTKASSSKVHSRISNYGQSTTSSTEIPAITKFINSSTIASSTDHAGVPDKIEASSGHLVPERQASSGAKSITLNPDEKCNKTTSDEVNLETKTAGIVDKKNDEKVTDKENVKQITLTVVSRATSPSPPASSSFVRSRRADVARTIQKEITRVNKKIETKDAEVQSDRMDDTARYSRFASGTRMSPWPSYLDKFQSPGSSYSRSSYESSRISNFGYNRRTTDNSTLAASETGNCQSSGNLSSDSVEKNLKHTEIKSENETVQETVSISEKREAPSPTSSVSSLPSSVSLSHRRQSLSRSDGVTAPNGSKSLSRNSSMKSVKQQRRNDSSSSSAVTMPSGRSKSASATSLTNQATKIKTTSASPVQLHSKVSNDGNNSSSVSVSFKQCSSLDARGKPPVPKTNDTTMKASGPSSSKYVNKDFRKSALNMSDGGDNSTRTKYHRKHTKNSAQRSLSVSSSSLKSDSKDSDKSRTSSSDASKSSHIPRVSSNTSIKTRSISPAVSSLVMFHASRSHSESPSRRKNSVCSTASEKSSELSTSDSSTSEDGDEMRSEKNRRLRRRRSSKTSTSSGHERKRKISISSSRTSFLALSTDELSLTTDKPPRISLSPNNTKSDKLSKSEEAKSFLIRTLTPVTNLRKSNDDEAQSDNWPSQRANSKKSVSPTQVSISIAKNNSKNCSDVNMGKERNESLKRQSSGEKPWWMESNSDNPSKEIEQGSIYQDEISQDTTVSVNLPDDGTYSARLWRQDSEEQAWWLKENEMLKKDSSGSAISRKNSSKTSSARNEHKNSLKHQQSGERAWWMSEDPSEVPEGIEVYSPTSLVSPINLSHDNIDISEGFVEDETFVRRVNRIRHIESGERAWWMDSNSNVPEGIENISQDIESSNSDDSSESFEKLEIHRVPVTTSKLQLAKSISKFPIEFSTSPIEKSPLGDRISPEGIENSSDLKECYAGRISPYDNVQSTHHSRSSKSSSRKRPSTLPRYISNMTNIDDLLGESMATNASYNNSVMQRVYKHEGMKETSDESSECEEIDVAEVIIHDSTPKTPVIQRRGRDKERPQPDGYIPLDDTALQLYKDGDYGAYLDLEASITEQQEEFEGFQTNRKNSIVLRTQLSVRVHTIIEKLLNSEGRELRRALFSLKQIFQEDKDLVHEFVQNDGLACLIKVGNEADQNYQNYILRALGQVMLYVDGMNGVMEHGQTVQWLYTLIASRFRLVVKTALKLLLVFVEYVETNSLLLVRAVRSVDTSRGMIPWTNVMKLLKDYDAADTELLIYATTLVNKCLNGIPDQDTYYDQVDCLEEQGIEGIIQRYMSKQGTDLDLLRQFQIYEAVLHHEDGNDRDSPIRQLDDNIRKTLRSRKSLVDSHERRKSRRHSTGTSPLSMTLNARLSPRLNHSLGLNSLNGTFNSSLPDDDDESSSSQSSQGLGDVQLNGSYKENKDDVGVTPALRRRRERAERQRSFIREQQEATANMRASIGSMEGQETPYVSNGVRYSNGSSYDRNTDSPSNKVLRANSRKDLTPLMNAANKLDSEEKKPWYGKSPDESIECNEVNHTNEDEDRRVLVQMKRESTVKDLTQKLTSQNIIPSSPENDKISRIGDMSGLISKAKEGLAKSKSKADILKSPTNDNLQKLSEVKKSENELHWEELVNKMKRPLTLCDLDFTDLNSDDEVDVLGPVNISNGIPPPPPPMAMTPINGIGRNAPPPPPPGTKFPPPLPNGPTTHFGINLKATRSPPTSESANTVKAPPQTIPKKNKKTVKLFWKEVRDDPIILSRLEKNMMIWDELLPVPIDTQKLEHLFESRAKDLISKKQQEMNKNKEIIVLDHKRSNAINIGMTKLPPPRSIKTAILKMDPTIMNREGIEKLLTMLPTEEERSRIQEAQAANPDLPLGSAEQFLLTLASISELPARLKLWAFKLDFENSEKEIADPLMDLKQGMETLRVNKTFRGILSTLLSIGIFLNGNEVKGFQLEYLTKVPEVKDTVHKHSLLHHLCHMVMEKFPDSTDLYSEIGAVTRASKIDFDELASNISKLESECKASWDHLKLIAKHDGSTMMKVKMSDFLADCAERIIVLTIVHRRIINRFHKFILWLGIPLHRVQDTKPNEFCRIISEFALEYRTTRERVIQQLEKKANHRERNKTRGKMITEVGKFRTKEDRADAELRQLLGSDISDVESIHGTLPWRRQRKDGRTLLGPIIRDETTNGNVTDGDDELLESLVKTATKCPSTRTTPRERKRTRNADRKSLRRTLKNGLSEEEKKHIAAYIKGY